MKNSILEIFLLELYFNKHKGRPLKIIIAKQIFH